MWRESERLLRTKALGGIGDERRERFFRMCVTACLHRGLTDAELAGLPASWHQAPAIDIAGGPVEVLWSKGIPDVLSARPCDHPTRKPFDPRRRATELWIPLDCGACPSCVARKGNFAAACAWDGARP
jgi:hypothetical protein